MGAVMARLSGMARDLGPREAAGAVVAAGVAAAAAYAWRLGLFSPMRLETAAKPAIKVVVKSLQCDVISVGDEFERVIALVNEALPAYKDNRHLPLGVYYDDPGALVDPSTLRVDIGIVLLNDKGDDYEAQADEAAIGKAIEPLGMKLVTIPKGDYVRGVWPFVNQLSFAIGPMKFYGGAEKIAKERNTIKEDWSGALEIHHMGASPPFTEYLMPLTHAVQITDIPAPPRKKQ